MDTLLETHHLEKYKSSKLGPNDILCIRKEDEEGFSPGKTSSSWSLLRKLIVLDGTARNTGQDTFENAAQGGFGAEEDLYETSRTITHSIHPLDVLCAVMGCSDSFLQQEIMTKMATCQFAVPLLLPRAVDSQWTLMLWAMRDIIKKWRPPSLTSTRGFMEENITSLPMPIFSFVRLGSCSLSKSQILNKILSPVHTHHDFFVHRDMECGYLPRTVSEGLLEMTWYFPGGNESSAIFQGPLAVANLRGDLDANREQFSFLTTMSSAVFIFSEGVQEKHCSFLESSAADGPEYFFIFCPPKGEIDLKMKEAVQNALNLKKNVLVKDSRMNDANIVKKIQSFMKTITRSLKHTKLEDLEEIAKTFKFWIDESLDECQAAKNLASKICSKITDVPQYKRKTLPLQGELWKKISQNEKELSRMRKLGDADVEEYRSQLVKRDLELRKQQSQAEFHEDMKTFLEALTDFSSTEKLFFLKWMKFYLDNIARSNLSELQSEYMRYSNNLEELKRIDRQMSDSSLGIENFLRELGQMHEAQFFSLSHTEFEGKFRNLPGIAADLLLGGFPLELINGETSTVPVKWVTDVLNEVDIRTGKKCTMRVITVLGVQSTGKSTLLNAMFGLQFPVASGRCTRGAFMTLLKVEETFQTELGCDFILVIDTEGLKAPELASLEGSYEHDNELATLVVGLSDITMINMRMENTAEMKDILQIVVHAFLRMKEVGKKPNCQFIHQNVSDPTAHYMNIKQRKTLLEHLNKMTKAAAKMEKLEGITSFNDIINYDLDKNTWYIPDLWYGGPPMASINAGYSEGILSLKKYLLQFMAQKQQKFQDIPTFLKWLQSLWNAVKHEKFIFSFRNSLVADAYVQLSVKYSQLEWNFRNHMYEWMTETLNSIKNQHKYEIVEDLIITINSRMPEVLKKEERQMQESLLLYFERNLENAHLVEKYLMDFSRSIVSLRRDLYEDLQGKCWDAACLQKMKNNIKELKDGYIAKIEAEVSSLLESNKGKEGKIEERVLEMQFESMWKDTIKGFNISPLKKQDVDQQMLCQLRMEMKNKPGAVNKNLLDVKQLSVFADASFVEKDEHIDLKWYEKSKQLFFKSLSIERLVSEDCFKAKVIAEDLLDKCTYYVEQKVGTKDNYHDMFCQELLNKVNNRIGQKDVQKLHTTSLFELDLKLLVLGKAAPKFQKMHDDFEFCQECLKPAMVDYVNNRLGQKIVSDVLQGEDNMKYLSRPIFQQRILRKLMDDHKFDQYIAYINNYECFVKKSISEFIKERYGSPRGLESLQSSLIISIIHKIRAALQEPQMVESKNVSEFLSNVCKALEKDLVISPDNIKRISFQNSASASEFSSYVDSFLSETGDIIKLEMLSKSLEMVLGDVTLKPEDELFKKVIGCGKQCPFCKVPCEAGCAEHSEHFATVHRPQGLGRYRFIDSNVLCSALCSTDVVTDRSFRNSDTDWKFHPYKDYRAFYPDWKIQPDPNISASEYWKFVFKEFNDQFAKKYKETGWTKVRKRLQDKPPPQPRGRQQQQQQRQQLAAQTRQQEKKSIQVNKDKCKVPVPAMDQKPHINLTQISGPPMEIFHYAGLLYLTKIHKHPTHPSVRPNVAGTESVFQNLATFLDSYNHEYLQQNPSCLTQVTKLNIIGNLGTLPPHTILCSMDVASLYTSIHHDTGIATITSVLEDTGDFKQFCVDLLTIILTKNYFRYDNEYYLQLQGTAMGSNVAPTYANLFLDRFECLHVYTDNSFITQVLYWARYIDDIFFLWQAHVDDLLQFTARLNSAKPTISFTLEHSDSQVHFLDVQISIKDHMIHTDLYKKEMDRNTFLRFDSFHPTNMKTSLPYSQFIRLRHIISDDHTYLERAETYIKDFLESDREQDFMELVEQLNMKQHLTSKLTLSDILSIGSENQEEIEPRSIKDLPWHFLRKLMTVNWTSRNTRLQIGQSTEESDDDDVDDADHATIHPLDIECILMHCSESFLQQEIVTKLAMCQFAVPLLLPAGIGSNSTFMLWAMRDIVKKWRPASLVDSKGFKEDNVVNISMPVISFVRLGKDKLSKSKILNQIINPVQQHHNFFVHNDIEGGNTERQISDGLVEISWYFPNGQSDVFPEPITVTNLRGDIESHWNQFLFLTRVSSAVFIFVESISENQFRLLSSVHNKDTYFYFIVSPGPGKYIEPEMGNFLKHLVEKLNVRNKQILVKRNNSNDSEFANKIQTNIGSLLNKPLQRISIENMKTHTDGLQIDVDENLPECQKARQFTRNITSTIRDVEGYKKEMLKLQGDLWKQLSKVEKEICRMANQGQKATEEYLSELKEQRIELHRKQYQHDLPEALMLFINAITQLSQVERHYFLKWMKIELDVIARRNLSALQLEYKEKMSSNNPEELKLIDQKLSDSSLGVEHFLRELGQFYEAECSMLKENIITRAQFTQLPGIAADLLLDGFPLELIDGDASNIPLMWITDVLSQINLKTGHEENKIRVITVLGVQSTGKSTLLNTMFGLQFPVSSGRCTRGAFMTLLKVKENLQDELRCKFILVIDTEGLKAPELASLEDSYEHDNELATLVVGLSDITIVNMAMENTSEMKDILQIVVHAFLRMKETGKKNNCQFVHQNVSDVSAYEKNMRDRKKLLEQLDEMTRVAAKMEKKSGIKAFDDVMDYDLENHNWYIPGLWQGVPPMAPVSFGYSENVHKLKKHLIEFMKTQNAHHSIEEFIKWIESLWRAVKHEKFIFSFRNSLVAEAYNNLSMQFSLWEWAFSKEVYNFVVRTENSIRNQCKETLNTETCDQYRRDLLQLTSEEENKMLELLEKYYESNSGNVHLVERYHEDFRMSVEFLKKELERNALNKCNMAITIQKGKFEVQSLQKQYQRLIEEKIDELLETGQNGNSKRSDHEIQQEFESMWRETVTNMQVNKLDRRNVGKTILQQLRDDMRRKGSDVQQKLKGVNALDSYGCQPFKVDKKYIDVSLWKRIKWSVGLEKQTNDITEDFALSIIQKCDMYIKEKFDTREDYDGTYCQEILHMINKEMENATELSLTKSFELDLKLFICGKAAQLFQKMHDEFTRNNDPMAHLENLKPQYLATFLNIFHEKDQSQCRARQFCEQCLQPAMTDFIFKHLGAKIVDDILHSSDSKIFGSRSFFQCNLLENLLEEMSFQKYVDFIQSYEKYTETWILNYISNNYHVSSRLKDLYGDILTSIGNRIQDVLEDRRCLESPDIESFLEEVCEMLQSELVIPQNEIKVITFHNKAAVGQFSSDIQSLLVDTEEQIQSELEELDTETLLSRVTLKPQRELFRKVVGCGKQCPFCKVPCEAGGGDHTEHFSSIHRPQGLGKYKWNNDKTLIIDLCSRLVVSNAQFSCTATKHEWHPYKEYKTIYPDWAIQPDPSIESSDYWKYIFVQFNEKFAVEYSANPARLPEEWKSISKSQALESLKKVFNVK
ncbi:LOW QUALITY PROTEIN: uncharacterized protein PAF06_013880 [Gastrophryne carolinensis]